ncbi:hypothetical protein [Mesobacterium pallidum]|uniref:hypothetical protein n=1 Tax=Mesobacterium pallidum TaxID=2872037 RepID=UPI001EE22210|nr:hypothetical protein [Mesobacterium pallidum]
MRRLALLPALVLPGAAFAHEGAHMHPHGAESAATGATLLLLAVAGLLSVAIAYRRARK